MSLLSLIQLRVVVGCQKPLFVVAILCWCFATVDVDSDADGNAVIDVNVEVDMRA